MRSSNIQYLAPIDHLRAVAALMVLGYHSLHYVQSSVLRSNTWAHFDNPLLLVLYEGYAGVSLFFVISGFLFTYATDGPVEFRARDFWFNRFVRIYPMFFFVVFVAVTIGGSTADLKGLFLTLVLLGTLSTCHKFISMVERRINPRFTMTRRLVTAISVVTRAIHAWSQRINATRANSTPRATNSIGPLISA
jgi:peptidoglycan/LPS O-acetylase OafA/YrhL